MLEGNDYNASDHAFLFVAPSLSRALEMAMLREY